jgi:hypothetical protein
VIPATTRREAHPCSRHPPPRSGASGSGTAAVVTGIGGGVLLSIHGLQGLGIKDVQPQLLRIDRLAVPQHLEVEVRKDPPVFGVAGLPDRADDRSLLNPRPRLDLHVVQVRVEAAQRVPVLELDEAAEPPVKPDLHDGAAADGAHRAVQVSHEIDSAVAAVAAARRLEPPIPLCVLPDEERPLINRRHDAMPIDVGQLKC